MRITVAHLYPGRLNIYADRGNIAVLRARARARDIGVTVVDVERGDPLPEQPELVYIGGGQDRDQAHVADDLAGRGEALRALVSRGVPLLAVCGGYQLLGRRYVGRDGASLDGADVFPLETLAGDGRLIGDVLLDCNLGGTVTGRIAGFENHVGRTVLDADATALGTVVHGFGNNGEDGLEGCRVKNALGTYLHGPLLPRNPWLADWLLERSLEAAGSTITLQPLDDRLEAAAFAVAADRAAARGGKS